MLALLLAIPNAILSLIGRKFFKQAGFDITPWAIMMVAAAGQSIIFGAIILCLSKALNSINGLRNLWMTIPLTLSIGFLSLVLHDGLVLLITYHALSLIMALAVHRVHVKYIIFVLINVSINLWLIKILNPF